MVEARKGVAVQTLPNISCAITKTCLRRQMLSQMLDWACCTLKAPAGPQLIPVLAPTEQFNMAHTQRLCWAAEDCLPMHRPTQILMLLVKDEPVARPQLSCQAGISFKTQVCWVPPTQ